MPRETTQSQALTVNTTRALAVAQRIDEIASGAMEVFKSSDSFEKDLAIAQAVADLRAALTEEVMQPVMALMNTNIGFKTDRNPLAQQGVQPYSWQEVREVFIESKLRGFRTTGNEFNIIAGGFYGAQNGFNRLCKSFPGVTEFKETYEVPRMHPNGEGAIVKCKATWKLNGRADSVEREFPIKVNKFMGNDAILGKAKRKLLKAAYDQMTGTNTPEGDPGDSIDIETEVVKEAPATPTPKFEPTKTSSKPATAVETQAAGAPSSSTAGSSSAASAQDELANVVIGAGHNFDKWKMWAESNGYLEGIPTDNVNSFEEVPENLARLCIGAKSGLLNALKSIR